ncbi:hypothetical protein [Streptomyces flaveus]|uniref:hypothetical protein n=1 Tax=Streptomyces flaveus TaxID=66370 RepID=UPI0033332315
MGIGSCAALGADFDSWIGDWAGNIRWDSIKGREDAGAVLLAAYCTYEDTRPFIGSSNEGKCGPELLKQLESYNRMVAPHSRDSGVGSGLAKLFKKLGTKLGVKRTPPMNQLAHNRALFEKYKDALREEMAKPFVKDPDLVREVNKLYRPNAQVGSGSTAAAVRLELANGGTVGGRHHSQKAEDSIVFLTKWLRNNPTASADDRAAAENLIRDVQNALKGL